MAEAKFTSCLNPGAAATAAGSGAGAAELAVEVKQV